MMRSGPLPLAAWLVLVLAGVRANDLGPVWLHSPRDAWGWLAFGLWAAPAFWAARRPAPGRLGFLIASLAFVVLATLTDTHAVAHLALALAVSAFAGATWATWPWLASAVSWLPALNSVADLAGFSLPPAVMVPCRLLIAALGASWLAIHLWRQSIPTPSRPA
jgi:hypothetical protein